MTRAQARAWKRRWRLVNQAEIEELRRTPMEQKLRQLAVLMASTDEMGWTEQLAAEEEQVRKLWIRLRKAARARRT